MTRDNEKKRLFTGKVISDKMEKTVVVKVERKFRHPKLGKVIRRFRKFKVHDDRNEARIGDTISFYEGRPLSKTKFMYLYERIEINQ
jgi:small subunit ribosomal protein S17